MNGHFKVMAIHRKQARMATTNKTPFLFFFITLLFSAHLLQGIETEEGWVSQSSDQTQKQQEEQSLEGRKMKMTLKIGSTLPTCTYNECRGCKHKCTAEQVPVEGNDPLNSPYHYRCICHRS